MRIGIFGGSFDPVHIEHVRLAEAAVESLALDALLIMPAHTPPHKTDKALSSDGDRLEMCRLAFEGCKKTQVSDYEMRAGGTSFTYLTCRHFRRLYPDATLYWLVGTDMLRDFPSWKNPEEILSLATLAVCARNEPVARLEKEAEDFYARFCERFEVIAYRGGDVSSTKIRALAAAGEDISPFTGKRVAAYVADNGLYEIPHAKEALDLEKPSRRAHSVRVAVLAAERAAGLKIDEKRALTAALFHDCAKNLPPDSPRLEGFTPPSGVPAAVVHQYAGAYVAEHAFGISDGEILDAIRYHTSGRENMSLLGKLIFLADMLESGRDFEGVEELRAAFRKDRDSLDECLYLALSHMLNYLADEGKEAYPLTRKAYEFIEKEIRNKTERRTNNV